MVDWNSPNQLAFDEAAFAKMIHVFAAIYFWEFVISLDFEYSFIKGTRKFNWPMLPYFCGRYSCILLSISAIIVVNSPTLRDCKTLYMVPSIGAVLSTTWASTNLAIRAMVIWSLSWWCVIPLCLLIAGQWAFTLPTAIMIEAVYDTELGSCVETHIYSKVISASYIYIIFVDFTGLCFCTWRLINTMKMRTRLSSFLFKDGMAYFITATLINVPSAVLSFSHTNPAVQAILVVPSGVVATIAASRAVRRLSNFRELPGGPAIYMTATNNRTPIEFRGQDTVQITTLNNSVPQRVPLRNDGVHVQMDTFTRSDTTKGSNNKSPSLTKIDVDGDDMITTRLSEV